jgi:rubrerythrin
MSLQDVLEIAIEDEEEARDYYKRAAELTGNPHTRQMLLGLSDREQGHADQLRKELDELILQRDLEAGIAD